MLRLKLNNKINIYIHIRSNEHNTKSEMLQISFKACDIYSTHTRERVSQKEREIQRQRERKTERNKQTYK